MNTITMNELEALCGRLDPNIAKQIEETQRLLNSLPPKKIPNASGWARCVIVCNVCGREETSAHIATFPNLWCPKCGESRVFDLKFRLVRN